jgi:tetratricopeptide (TPR) repeat protein
LLETLRDLALFTKDYLTAYNTILKIEEVLGSSVEIYFQKSALQEELNNIDLAINFMYEAYSVDSSNIDVLQRIVTLLMDQDKNEEALLYNEKITKKFPNDSKGFINIALMALSAEKPEEAIDILGRNSEKFIDDFTLQYLLGSAYYQRKNYTDAKYHLNQALVIFPESRNTKHNLALIYDATNEWVKSDKLYTELISSDSLDAQAYNNFAYSLVERKENLDLALELSLTAIRLSPQSAAYLDTVGWIYYKMKQFDKAVKYIEESLEIDSSNITIQQHLNEIINNRTELNQSKIQQVEN